MPVEEKVLSMLKLCSIPFATSVIPFNPSYEPFTRFLGGAAAMALHSRSTMGHVWPLVGG